MKRTLLRVDKLVSSGVLQPTAVGFAESGARTETCLLLRACNPVTRARSIHCCEEEIQKY
ncbi:hypothetical protein H5410_031475 [Solanum commersonii]|uniref:Uncharacterized protein n=1 Tax=Solanum commersonii TaxID=4109 RepID=A0A9J5YIH2_SOLCO|nr:hypothetical protein H5410_031475 [Solanum commersonii]